MGEESCRMNSKPVLKKSILHELNRIDVHLSGINCIAVSDDLKNEVAPLVAFSRKDGSIEVYKLVCAPPQYDPNTSYTPKLPYNKERVYTGKYKEYQLTDKHFSLISRLSGNSQNLVTSLKFVSVGNRVKLFSTNMAGLLVEWDYLETLRPLQYLLVSGGSINCMEVSNSGKFLALGSEDGSVSLVDLFEDAKLEIARKLNHRFHRILCLDWSPDDSFIAVGTEHLTVEKLDVASGRLLITYDLQSSKTGFINPVWSIKVLSDGVIVTGDSLGTVTFTDGKFGTLITRLSPHEAEVLALCKSTDGKQLYSAGVDDKVVRYQVDSEDSFGWVQNKLRRCHIHDCNALAYLNFGGQSYLLSGGNDFKLYIHNLQLFDESHPGELDPFRATREMQFQLAHGVNLLMLTHPDQIHFFGIGKVLDDQLPKKSLKTGTSLKVTEPCRHIIKMTYHNIIASAINSIATYVLISDVSKLRLFNTVLHNVSDSKVSIHRVASFPPQNYIKKCGNQGKHVAKLAQFCASGKYLYIVNLLGQLVQFNLTSAAYKFKVLFDPATHLDKNQEVITKLIVKFSVNLSTSTACLVFMNGSIVVFGLEKFDVKHRIPVQSYPLVDVKLVDHHLLVTLTNFTVIQYDLSASDITSSILVSGFSPENRSSVNTLIRNQSFEETQYVQTYLLYSSDSITSYYPHESLHPDFVKYTSARKPNEGAPVPEEEVGEKVLCKHFKSILPPSDLVYLDQFHNGHLLAVGVDMLTLLKRQGPALQSKIFMGVGSKRSIKLH